MKKISPWLHAKLTSGAAVLMERSKDKLLKAQALIELDAAVELGLETAEAAETKRKDAEPDSVVMLAVRLTDYHDALERYKPDDEIPPSDAGNSANDNLSNRRKGTQPPADSGSPDVRETERS